MQPQTGQAIVLAPSGIGLFALECQTKGKEDRAVNDEKEMVLSHFGRRYLIIKTRRRVTADGGASVLVVDESESD
jgi:hypothetical protein